MQKFFSCRPFLLLEKSVVHFFKKNFRRSGKTPFERSFCEERGTLFLELLLRSPYIDM